MTADLTVYRDTATALLTAVEAALAANPPARPVARAFLSHNAPAWDLCSEDQLTVHVLNVGHRVAGRSCQVQSRIELHIQIVRCVPGLDGTGRAPTVDELETSAEGLLIDLRTIEVAVVEALPGLCSDVTPTNASPLGPQGYVAGWDYALTSWDG